jgi:hypothetical protein
MVTKHFCDICGNPSSESGLQKISFAVFLSGETENQGLNKQLDICKRCRIYKMYDMKTAIEKVIDSFQSTAKPQKENQ